MQTRFLLFLFLALSLPALGQTDYVRLQNLSETFTRQSQQWRQEVLEKSAFLRLPLRQSGPEGEMQELIRFDGDLPLYYTTYNDHAARTIRTIELLPGGASGYNLTGAGEFLGIWDSGPVRTSHQEFPGDRVSIMDGSSDPTDHGTHVGGTMVAAGTVASARGMSPEADLHSYDWFSDWGEMANAAYYGLQVSNHSYGYITGWEGNTWYGNPSISPVEDYRFGFYGSASRALDQIARAAPYYTIVWAAGNDRNDKGPNGAIPEPDGGADGYDCIGMLGVAKNILTIGAVSDIRNGYSQPSDVVMSSFSSWGPTDDGRIKPDLVGNGISLYSPTAGGDAHYGYYSGTSMATPNVSGSIGLLLQQQRNLYGQIMYRASTLKALLIHTADEAGDHDGPDYRFGWGLANFARAAQLIDQSAQPGYRSIREYTLQEGQTIRIPVVKAENEPLRVTVAWTDPEGNPPPASLNPPDKMLVHDIDVRIHNGQTHYPWVLDPATPAAPASTGDNTTDNVEQVLVDHDQEEFDTVLITHKGTLLDGQQAISVILSGTKPVPPRLSLQSIPSGHHIYWAADTLEAAAEVDSLSQLTLMSGQQIRLKPGFFTQPGASLSARIVAPPAGGDPEGDQPNPNMAQPAPSASATTTAVPAEPTVAPQVFVSPNPASEFLRIHPIPTTTTAHPFASATLEVFDLRGVRVKHHSGVDLRSTYHLPVHDLLPGWYRLRLIQDGQLREYTFVKER